MKVLKIIKKIIVAVLVIAFFGFAITMAILRLNYNKYGVTQIGDTSLMLINGEMASDNYKKGDLVLAEEKKLKNVNVGDVMFAYRVDEKSVVSIQVGTVDKLHVEEDAISFKNGDTYGMELVAGKAGKVYDNLGTFLSIIESKWGFLFLILVPIVLIFIYQVYALIVEVKYGSEPVSN